MHAAAVTVVAAAVWSSARRALVGDREAVAGLQNGDQVLGCKKNMDLFVVCPSHNGADN